MGLEVGGGGTEKEEEEEEKEKIPLCESIGHRPLWGRCPAPTLNYNHDLPKQGTGTADHLTLLRLLSFSFFRSGTGCTNRGKIETLLKIANPFYTLKQVYRRFLVLWNCHSTNYKSISLNFISI